jgi:hypothetical protein
MPAFAGVLHWRVKPSAVVTWLMDILAGRADAGGDHDGSRPAFVKSHHADPAQGITKVTVAVFFDFTVHTPYTLEYESGLHRFLAAPDFLTAVLESQDTHTSPPDDGALRVRQTATGAATTATAFPSDNRMVPTVPAPPSSVVTSTIHQTTGVTAPSAMGAPSTSAPQRSSKVAKVPAGVLKDRLNVIAGEADVGDVVKAGVPVKKGTNDAVAEGEYFGGWEGRCMYAAWCSALSRGVYSMPCYQCFALCTIDCALTAGLLRLSFPPATPSLPRPLHTQPLTSSCPPCGMALAPPVTRTSLAASLSTAVAPLTRTRSRARRCAKRTWRTQDCWECQRRSRQASHWLQSACVLLCYLNRVGVCLQAKPSRPSSPHRRGSR